MNIKIRKFQKKDAERCAEIKKNCWECIFSKVYSKEYIKEKTNKSNANNIINDFKNTFAFVILKDNKIIGMCGIKGSKKIASLKLFFIDPEQRNKGYGSDLYDHIEKSFLSKNKDYLKIVLDAPILKPTICFYEKMGFKKIKTKKLGKIKTAYMEKVINKIKDKNNLIKND